MRAPCSDPRAVTDPIEGSLELSRTVRAGLPLLLGAILLSSLFIGGWLVLLAGGMMAAGADLLSTGRLAFAGQIFLLSLPLWLAVLALGLLWRTAAFFRGFGAGHIAVGNAADADPNGTVQGAAQGLPGTAHMFHQGGGMPSNARSGILRASGGPFGALLLLAREPSGRAGMMASALRLMGGLFLPLLALLAADAALLGAGETLLWRFPPEGGAIIDVLLIFVGLGALGAIMLSHPLLGWVALRLGAIDDAERAQSARIPPGKAPLERYIRYLSADGRHRHVLEEMLRTQRTGGAVSGASGNAHPFDLYLQLPPGTAFGPARSLFVRALDRPPAMADIDGLENDVLDVVSATKIPPAHVVLIFAPNLEGPFVERVEDAVFERLMERHLSGKAGWKRYCCAIELVTEEPDGSYDLVPFKAAGV